jgi:hypothetical protein
LFHDPAESFRKTQDQEFQCNSRGILKLALVYRLNGKLEIAQAALKEYFSMRFLLTDIEKE